MSTYEMSARDLPLDDAWDVVVVGGGPAGCAAATAAARDGAKTLLIEATGCLGGMGTVGLVPAWCPYSDKQGNFVYRGLAEWVFQRARQAVPHEPLEKLDWVAINPEQLKNLYDGMIASAGATVRFFTTLVGADTDTDGHVTAIVLASKAGLSAVRAKVYIDCTGDADLAAFAGVDFHQGDETGELQPATHCFALAGVNEYAYRLTPLKAGKESIAFRIAQDPNYPDILDSHLCNNLVGPGVVGFNAGHLWDVDGTDTLSLSDAMAKGRRIAQQFRDALAEYHPAAFANSFVVATGPLMGIRETRRIVGLYELTVEDYLARRKFPDEIARNNYWIDIHTAKSEIDQAKQTWGHVKERFEHYGPGETHGIPYRCLVPASRRNLLVAGRSISCDRAVQGTVRVMPVCLATGEAAGAAAAMAGDSADVTAVDASALRDRLRHYGGWLPDVPAEEPPRN